MKAICALLFLLVLLAADDTTAIVIDDFSSGLGVSLVSGQTVASATTNDSAILGGRRHVTVHDTSGTSSAALSFPGSGLVYSRSNEAPATSFFFASWDGGFVAGNLGVDLTVGEANAFQIDVLSLDGTSSLWVTVTDFESNSSRAYFENANGAVTTGLNRLLFSDLQPLIATPADLTSIDRINIRYQGPGTALAGFATVPEPASGTLVLVGLVMLSCRRTSRVRRTTAGRPRCS